MPLGIRVSWNKNNDDTEEYGVWRRTENGEPSEITRVPQPEDDENPYYNDENIDIEDPTAPEVAVDQPTSTSSKVEVTTASTDASNPVYYYSIRAYDEAGNESPLCPEVSLQPSNAIDRYEWSLIDEADSSVVDSGTIDPSDPISSETELEEGSYHYEVKAVDLSENESETTSSDTFTV